MRRMRLRTAYVILGIGACLAAVMVWLIVAPARTAPPPIDGCSEVTNEELYVQRAYVCGDGSRVVTFSDVTARDAYMDIATHYGVITLSEGNAWVRIRTS